MQATQLCRLSTRFVVHSPRLLPVKREAAALIPHGTRRRYISDFSKQDSFSSRITTGFHGGSVAQAVQHDHRELEQYYHKIVNAKDDDTKTRYQNQFIWELARHSIAEEIVIYPAMEQYVDGGKEAAARDRMDHNIIKERLYKFQNMKPSDKEFGPTLGNIWQRLSHHIEDEEGTDLPALEKNVPQDLRDKIARSFARTKMFVPTRSHPRAPDKPPFETVAALMAAPIDKLSDLFRRFPKEEDISSR